ncbi:MAG TPA: chemotaxis protein CheW [Gemmatimonadaceae bacterium]|nr:chemotaxis protein CheW [Gemmatimonadaceae bacterium]
MPDFLLFTLDQRRFALPVAPVREAVAAVAITPLAGAPGVIEGVIDVRGTPTPVLDLRARFEMRPKPLAVDDHLVLASAGERPVALRVDRVTEVVSLDDDLVSAARPDDPAMRHLAGVAHLPDGLVLIADLEAFFTQGEAEALARALAAEREAGRDGERAGAPDVAR